MIEIKGDMWKELGNTDVICITTNGFIKRNGEAVMGRGCAKQAALRFPELPQKLGHSLKENGNICTYLWGEKGTEIWSFPVKPKEIQNNGTNIVRHMQSQFQKGAIAPGWAAKADIRIILKSAEQLLTLANTFNWKTIVIPRPGCGAGELNWEIIKPQLNKLLDSRFIAITY